MAQGRVIFLLFVLGVVTNLLVAWAVSTTYLASTGVYDADRPFVDRGGGVLAFSYPPTPAEFTPSTDGGVWTALDPPGWSELADNVDYAGARRVEIAAGWPLASLRCSETGESCFGSPLGNDTRGSLSGLLLMNQLKSKWMDVTRIPVRPIPLNLLAGGLFWALVWALVLCAPNIMRQILGRWRRRRVRCPNCNYDLAATRAGRCPECGWETALVPATFTLPPPFMVASLIWLIVLTEAVLVASFVGRQPAHPIHQAAWSGDVDAVRAELDRGIDRDLPVEYFKLGARDNQYFADATPIQIAAKRGHLEVVALLLDRGAWIDSSVGVSNLSPLDWAIKMGHVDVALRLIEAGAGFDDHDVFSAQSVGDYEVVMALMGKKESDADRAVVWDALLGNEIHKSDLIAFEDLLTHGATPGFRCLSYAIEQGRIDLFERSVALGADLTEIRDGQSLLHYVPGRGLGTTLESWDSSMAAMWQAVIDAGVDVDGEGGFAPLTNAALFNRAEPVRFLIEHGATIATGDNLGQTALSIACEWQHMRVVRPLLDAGAVPGFASVRAAVNAADHELLDLLLAHGGRLDTRGDFEQTLLFCRKSRRMEWLTSGFTFDERMIRRLLDAGVDVNAQADNGETALHCAAASPFHTELAMLRSLLQHGADPTIRDANGRTALEVASQSAVANLRELIADFEDNKAPD